MKDFRSQFRLPIELAEKLKNSAEQNRRSLNAEIVNRLDRSYEDDAEQLDRIESGVKQLLSRQ